MISLARKNLLHDKVRFAITLSGVAFAVALVFLQVGLFLGLLDNASITIERMSADLWVTSRNTPNVDFAQPFPETRVQLVRSVPGVERADNLIVWFMRMALPSGAQEGVLVYALEDFSQWNVPWRITAGELADLKRGAYFFLDSAATRRMGPSHRADRGGPLLHDDADRLHGLPPRAGAVLPGPARERDLRGGEAGARRLAEAEVERARRLLEANVGTRQALDRAERDRDAARARRATAQAETDRLAVLVAKARITAPISGAVLARHVDPGETVTRGAPVATIADLSRTRVEAEVAEFDAGRVALGAPAVVTAEGFPGLRWSGRVEEIPDVVVNRLLKPLDPGRPSDTRVLLVKIALGEPTPLKLGQRVEVEVEIGAGMPR